MLLSGWGTRCPVHTSFPQAIETRPRCLRQAGARGNLQHNHSLRIVCMATPRRQARVAKNIEREVGALFVSDPMLQSVVSPERHIDSVDAVLASITDVQVTGDLQIAKVYVSITGSDTEQERAMNELTRMRGYVRKHVARTVRLRFVPEIRFYLDNSIEQDEQLLAAFERARQQAAGEIEPPPIVLRGGYLGTHASQNPEYAAQLGPAVQQPGAGGNAQFSDTLADGIAELSEIFDGDEEVEDDDEEYQQFERLSQDADDEDVPQWVLDDRAEALLDELEQEDLFEQRSMRGSDAEQDEAADVLPTTSQPEPPAAARPPARGPVRADRDQPELTERTEAIVQEQENLLDKLQAAGFFGAGGGDDEDDFDMMLEDGLGGLGQAEQPQQRKPTTARGRKKLKSVGRRRHLSKGSRAPR
ncbi:hypothetical protein WJX73_004871 [Symbiochloris irregularis]|uniref:Ribosome-binding factor A n=1 Tax=Symbiochloris irregularis TaxID=706552 RepID=A0AAW1PC37_9CHLO